VKLVLSLPNKQCLSDPLPTWLLQANVDILSPFLCQLFNRCLEHGIVPSSFKSGYVTPLLKKADLDAADVKSRLPITTLSVLSKLLERLVAQQLIEYLTENGLLPELQSPYRAHHSTETAMLKVMGDILLALDSGNLAMLFLLDLLATFDTVDHDTLLRKLQTSYNFGGIVIKWFISYISGRVQYVRTPTTTSYGSPVVHGVPQGSVFGPILFLLYVADMLKLIKRHQLVPHAYADDIQIYGFCRPSSVNCLADRVSACIDEVSSWMRSKRLQVNQSKTDALWCSSS